MLNVSLCSILALLMLVGVFIYDRMWGIRALGVAMVVGGIECMRTQRIPYGIRGRPPSGYLTGRAAVAIGVVAVGLGVLSLIAPKAVEPIFCGRRGCA